MVLTYVSGKSSPEFSEHFSVKIEDKSFPGRTCKWRKGQEEIPEGVLSALLWQMMVAVLGTGPYSPDTNMLHLDMSKRWCPAPLKSPSGCPCRGLAPLVSQSNTFISIGLCSHKNIAITQSHHGSGQFRSRLLGAWRAWVKHWKPDRHFSACRQVSLWEKHTFLRLGIF